jgi:hypothetical protein
VDLGRTAVVPALAALGVERLEVVIASHADLDHRGGLRAVLEGVPTDRLWLPAGGREDPAFESLVAAAEERGIEVAEKGRGDPGEHFADLRVTPLWPPRSSGLSRNDASLVVRVEVAGSRVLLTGDIEAPTEAALLSSGADLRAEVLELPHHGSRTSATSAFLRAGSQCGDRIGAVSRAFRNAPSGGARSRGGLGDSGVVDGAGRRGAGRPLAPAGGERLGTPSPGPPRLSEPGEWGLGLGAGVGQQDSEGECTRTPIPDKRGWPLKPPRDKALKALRSCHEQDRCPHEFENADYAQEVRESTVRRSDQKEDAEADAQAERYRESSENSPPCQQIDEHGWCCYAKQANRRDGQPGKRNNDSQARILASRSLPSAWPLTAADTNTITSVPARGNPDRCGGSIEGR